MTKRIKLFLVGVMACLLAVSAIFLVLNTNTAKATQQTLTGSKAQAEVTAEVDLSSFALTDSASIRTQSPKGIRFQTTVAKAQVANLPDNAVFGTLMLPTELLDGELTLTTENVANAKAIVYSENGNNYEYLTALVGSKNDDAFEDFSSAFYTKEITARSYVTYTYGEGTTVTKYSNAVSWSVGQTAGNLLAKKGGELQSEQITFLKGIVDAVKVNMYTVEQTPVILTQNIVGGAFDVDLTVDAEDVIGVYGDNYTSFAVVDSDTIKITLDNAAVTGNVSFTVITEKAAYNLTVDINVLESMKATLTGGYIAQFDNEHYADMVSEHSSYYFEGGMKTEIVDTFQGENGVLKISGKINGVNGQIIAGVRMPKEFTTSYTIKFYVVGKDFEGETNVAPGLVGFCNTNGGYVSGGHWYDTGRLSANTWYTKTITPTEAGDTVYFMCGWAKGYDLEAYIAFVYDGTLADMAMDDIKAGLKSYEAANFLTPDYANLVAKYSHSSLPASTAQTLPTYEGKTGVLKVTAGVQSNWESGFDIVLPKDVSGKKILVTFRFEDAALFKFANPDAKGEYLTADLVSKKNTWVTYELDYTNITADKLSVYMLCNYAGGVTSSKVYFDEVIIPSEVKPTVAATLDAGEVADFDSNAYLYLLALSASNPAVSYTAEVLESVTLGGETRENVLKLAITLKNSSGGWSFVSLNLPAAHSGTYTIEFFMNQEDFPSAGQAGIDDGNGALTKHDWQKFGAWTKKSFTVKAGQVNDTIAFGMVNHPAGNVTFTIYIDTIYDGTVA